MLPPGATPGATPGAYEAHMRKVKSSVVVFDGTYTSNADGTAARYLVTDTIREGLGQASSLRLAIQTSSRSANARLKFRLFETSGPRRPTALGANYAAFFTSADITAAAPQPIQISGPFADNVDLALDVSASTGSAEEQWTGTVYIVRYFD